MPIPKIIHQIWIGSNPRPSTLMDTWRDKNPDFEYILWTEEEIKKRGFQFECIDAINKMTEIAGKADIMRLEILYRYGGFYIDADSICLEPLDDYFLCKTAFACYENENVRKGLVANGNMGFMPKYRLCRDAIDWILNNDTCPLTTGLRAWALTGPVLLTNLLETGKYQDFIVFPSHCFLPTHFTGDKYEGHKKVYAFQLWGSTFYNYDKMNLNMLPEEMKRPNEWVSVLVSSYNTKHIYITECLESIRTQIGHFGIELVWINDGSNDLNTQLLELELERFRKTTRYCKVVYKKMSENMGINCCLNEGIQICSNEIVFKMDSDDIMVPDRMRKELEFMKNNPNCVIVGSNIQYFHNEPKTNNKYLGQVTNHIQVLTWEDYKKTKSQWIMNHPTVCYRKSAVLSVGSYNADFNFSNKHSIYIGEDFELELKLLKMYGVVYNIPEVLLYYRIHPDQTTYNGKSSKQENHEKRLKVIEYMINTP